MSMASDSIAPPGIRHPALRTIINPVTKEVATFTRYSTETDGQFFEVKVTVGGGGFVPLHYHALGEETFTSVSSVIYFQVGPREVVLQPGEAITVAAGQVHRFYNPAGEDMTFTVRGGVAAKGDIEGWEKGLYIWYGLARDGKVRADGIAANPLHVAVIMYMQDTWIAGWGFWLMTPVFALLHAAARWSGVEEELVRKYWVDAGCEEVSEERPLLGRA